LPWPVAWFAQPPGEFLVDHKIATAMSDMYITADKNQESKEENGTDEPPKVDSHIQMFPLRHCKVCASIHMSINDSLMSLKLHHMSSYFRIRTRIA
jgi:hypothetical protein